MITCQACQYWRAHVNAINPEYSGKSGECMFNPPVVTKDQGAQFAESNRPVTGPDDFCSNGWGK